MIKREITETIYEYDKEGKLLKKTVTETHETEENTWYTNTNPFTYVNCDMPNITNTTADINMTNSIQGTCGGYNSCGKCN